MGYMDKQPSRMPGLGRARVEQDRVGHARVGVGQGRETEAHAFLVLPLPAALTRATFVGGN